MKKKFAAELLIVFAAVPLCVAAGSILFSDRRYFVFSLAIALLSILIFFLSFEKRERSAHRLVILSALTALSVAGRFIFAPVPFFKPVTAIVTICGMYIGFPIEFSLYAGTVDSVSDVYLGTDRFYRRSSIQAAEGQCCHTAAVRRTFRDHLLRIYGYMDNSMV